MLVAAHGYTEPQAHAALQKQARATRQRILDVAQAVIEGELQLPRDPSLEHVSPVV